MVDDNTECVSNCRRVLRTALVAKHIGVQYVTEVGRRREITVHIKGVVTNYGEGGGLQNGRGGHMKFYPYEKGGGGGKSFSHPEGGAQKVLG